jgi:hypothetical protein
MRTLWGRDVRSSLQGRLPELRILARLLRSLALALYMHGQVHNAHSPVGGPVKAAAKSILSLFCLAFVVAACDSNTDPELGRNVSISVTGEQVSDTTAPSTLTSAADFIQTNGADTLILTRVAIVLSEIEIERVEETECAAGEEEDNCEEFELGPILLELDLNGGVKQLVSAMIPPGSYDELEFEIDKPDDDDAADSLFVAANPDFADVSIRVEGTWNGEPFLFTQDVDEEQELDLSPPLVIEDEGAALNLTLLLDLSTWFVRGDGSLLDPRSALTGQVNEGLVEDNIKRSIEVFEDDDQDGERDS